MIKVFTKNAYMIKKTNVKTQLLIRIINFCLTKKDKKSRLHSTAMIWFLIVLSYTMPFGY